MAPGAFTLLLDLYKILERDAVKCFMLIFICFRVITVFLFDIFKEVMREYIQQHPELNMTQDDIVKTTLTKAERHLKDKSDGRPDKPPP